MYEDQTETSDDTRECEAMRKMFVGGLNRDTTEETFFNYFGQFGEMVDKVIITDINTKQSRGFGFITYAQSDSVENVFNSRPHVVDDKTLDVKRAMPREFNTAGAHSKTKKLFVGGFKGIDLTPEELQQYIESRHSTSFGTIEKVDFLKDRETNQNKGFGFIECSSFDFADRLAISEMSFLLKGRTLSIKKAEPKEGPGGPGAQGPGSRGGMRGGRGGRGGPPGGRGMRGGGSGMRGGGRGRGGMGRGGYGGNDNYGGNYGGNGGSYSTAYPSFNMNDGYNQNQGVNFGQGYGQNTGYGGPQSNTGGYGGNPAYNQQGYNQQVGGYGADQTNTYSGQGYNQSAYGNQSFGGGRGAGAARGGGNNRYQPY